MAASEQKNKFGIASYQAFSAIVRPPLATALCKRKSSIRKAYAKKGIDLDNQLHALADLADANPVCTIVGAGHVVASWGDSF